MTKRQDKTGGVAGQANISYGLPTGRPDTVCSGRRCVFSAHVQRKSVKCAFREPMAEVEVERVEEHGLG